MILGPLMEGLESYGSYSLLVLPDHPTPLELRTHTSDPVPYILYRSDSQKPSGVSGYDEFQALETGIFIENGYGLMDRFLAR